MPQDVYTECVNGELRPGDLVISMPGDAYGCLIGTVTQINKLGTMEHDAETDNETDNVHVDFQDADYSDKRIQEIEAAFTKLYREKKVFSTCPIDDAILAPESLIRITGIWADKLESISHSYDNAAAFCVNALRTRELIDRLDRNLSDYHESLQNLDKEEIIGEAGMIANMSDTHYYLTENHEFEASEVDYLLQFENPLEVVADKWFEHTGQMDDFPFVLDELVDEKAALLGGYELYKEPLPPEPVTGKPADIRQAARHEAERLLYELKSLKRPNHQDQNHYMARVSPEFIKLAGSAYDKLLFEAFSPPSLLTFAGDGKGGIYLSMKGNTRATVKVNKPSVLTQLQEAREQAAAHNATPNVQNQKRRDVEAL